MCVWGDPVIFFSNKNIKRHKKTGRVQLNIRLFLFASNQIIP